MSAIEIVTCNLPGDVPEAFLALGARGREAHTLPGPARDEREDFDPEHPFYRRGGRERGFLALRDGAAVARTVACLTPELAAEGIGLVGFFEATDDPAASRALLDAAGTWLAAQGMRIARGPMNRDTWHRYRWMVEGFDAEPILMEPTNPPFYAALFERAGFRETARYCSTLNEDLPVIAERHGRFLDRCMRNGCRFRPFDTDRAEDELHLLYRVSLDAFPDNFSYSPISEDEFMMLYRPVMRFLDPRLVGFALTPDGEPAGYYFGVPEWLEAASRNGESIPGGTPSTASRIRTFNFKTVCVVPRARRRGIGEAMVAQLYRAALDAGYARSRHCLMIMSNASRRYDEGVGATIKQYALYDRPLGD